MRKAQREREERVERNRLFGSGNAQWRPADSSVCRSIAKRGFRRDNVVSLCCRCVHSVFQLSTNTPVNMLTARDHTCTLCDHTVVTTVDCRKPCQVTHMKDKPVNVFTSQRKFNERDGGSCTSLQRPSVTPR